MSLAVSFYPSTLSFLVPNPFYYSQSAATEHFGFPRAKLPCSVSLPNLYSYGALSGRNCTRLLFANKGIAAHFRLRQISPANLQSPPLLRHPRTCGQSALSIRAGASLPVLALPFQAPSPILPSFCGLTPRSSLIQAACQVYGVAESGVVSILPTKSGIAILAILALVLCYLDSSVGIPASPEDDSRGLQLSKTAGAPVGPNALLATSRLYFPVQFTTQLALITITTLSRLVQFRAYSQRQRTSSNLVPTCYWIASNIVLFSRGATLWGTAF